VRLGFIFFQANGLVKSIKIGQHMGEFKNMLEINNFEDHHHSFQQFLAKV
jgi:hypothetical protein